MPAPPVPGPADTHRPPPRRSPPAAAQRAPGTGPTSAHRGADRLSPGEMLSAVGTSPGWRCIPAKDEPGPGERRSQTGGV